MARSWGSTRNEMTKEWRKCSYYECYSMHRSDIFRSFYFEQPKITMSFSKFFSCFQMEHQCYKNNNNNNSRVSACRSLVFYFENDSMVRYKLWNETTLVESIVWVPSFFFLLKIVNRLWSSFNRYILFRFRIQQPFSFYCKWMESGYNWIGRNVLLLLLFIAIHCDHGQFDSAWLACYSILHRYHYYYRYSFSSSFFSAGHSKTTMGQQFIIEK